MKKLLLFPFFILIFVSCSELDASWKVFSGNYYFLQGEYQKANIQYLRTAETGIEPDILNYNLGTVYHALGETESAVAQWEGVDSDGNELLAYRLSFNKGVLNYQLGNYQEAFNCFREALISNPSSIEARINIEHSFRKMNVQDEPVSGTNAEAPGVEPGGEDTQRVLEYIRRNEIFYPPEMEDRDIRGRDRDW